MVKFNAWYNGEGKSRNDQNGFDQIKNADVHTEVGYISCQFSLDSESTTPNENCIMTTLPNGDVFFASTTSGKIWKRKYADGVYSLVHTNTNSPNRGIAYFSGYLYYIGGTLGRVGRQAEGVASSEASWTSQTDTFATMTLVETTGLIPVLELYDYLYLGGTRYVDSISESTNTFTSNVLDIPVGYVIKDLARSDTYLIIASDNNSSSPTVRIFGWDTISSSYTFDDIVPESSFSAFIPTDDFLFMVCGTTGQIYYWSGKEAVKWYKLRNATTEHNPYARVMLNGRSLYGTADGDVYSINAAMKDLPLAIVQEYTASPAAIKGVGVSNGALYASTGSNISKVSTNYATATITTPEVEGTPLSIEVMYDSMPSGCSLGLESKVNGNAWVTETFTADTTNMSYMLKNGILYNGKIIYSQFRITMTPNGSSTPVLRSINIQ